MTDADRVAFAVYCQAWSDYREAVEAGREEDLGIVQKAAIRNMQSKAHREICKGCEMFGLSPADRSGVVAPNREDEDDLDTFVKQKPELKIRGTG